MSSENVGRGSKDRFSKIISWVCRFHNTLPASYYAHNVVSVGDIPHALGGFANIHKGQCSGQPVRIKAFRTQNAMNTDSIKHVRIPTISDDAGLRHSTLQRLYNEIVRWKYISHPNLLPFLGISETPPLLSIICPWMPNGNIVEYTKREKGANRLLLVSVGIVRDHPFDDVTDSSRNRLVV